MTNSKQKPVLPAWALILDVLGALPFVLGVYSLVTGELPFTDGREPGYIGVALIIIGALLMVPLLVVLVRRSVAGK